MAQTRVSLERVDDATLFVARNAQGLEVHVDDATTRPDGIGLGAGPMQLLLMGLAGCAAVDVVDILRKGRFELTSFRVEATGDRPDGVLPAPFRSIHLDFALEGDLTPDRVERAIRLSLEKYCSAAATLRHAARITVGYSVNGESFASNISLAPDEPR